MSIFAHGDLSFQEESHAAATFPDEAKMTVLVNRYFDFAVPSHRFFHLQTVQSWVQFVHSQDVPRDKAVWMVREAAVFLIMATALLYKVDEHGNSTGGVDSVMGHESEELRERYFQAAQSRLRTEKGVARLESVQARLASVLYLLNTSRLNQAWYMLGTTYQLVVALGLHRARSLAGPVHDCIVQECKKRCYWVAYTVDTYFSVMLGRPALMSEQGVDQMYPELANDENITAETVRFGSVVRDCVQAAPVFHARLAKVIREASNEQYVATRAPIERQIDTAQRLNIQISQWQQQLPLFLCGGIHPASLIPIFRRQLRVLQMAAAHAIMIVNRPLVLSQHLQAEASRPYVDKCLAAAKTVLELVLELVQQNHLFRAFWNFQYITFHALSVVYVYIIQQLRETARIDDGQHNEHHLCDLAAKVQIHLAEATQSNAPNLRYSIILEELKTEALRALHKRQAPRRQEVANPAVRDTEIGNTSGQGSQIGSLSEWDSLADFPIDPELWLQLDSFPFDGEYLINMRHVQQADNGPRNSWI